MDAKKELVFFLVIAFFATFLVQIVSLRAHELNHQQIFRANGIDSNVEYYFFGLAGAKTIPDSNYYSWEDARYANLAHSINESVSYNLSPFLAVITFCAIASFFVLLMIFKRVEKR